MMGNIITKVFDEQEIEKTLIIPSDAKLINSSTTLSGEHIETHQVFTKIEDCFEYCWDVDKIDGKIINITMKAIPLMSFINPDAQYIVSTDDSTKDTDYFDIDNIISGKFAKIRDISFTPELPMSESEKSKPKRRILL